jgi:hypothetical protein
MLIEFGTEWTLHQVDEFNVINILRTPKFKTNTKHYWYFVPCINIKENEDTWLRP